MPQPRALFDAKLYIRHKVASIIYAMLATSYSDRCFIDQIGLTEGFDRVCDICLVERLSER